MKIFVKILEKMIKPESLDSYKKVFGDLVHDVIKIYGSDLNINKFHEMLKNSEIKRHISFLSDPKYFSEGKCDYLIDDPSIKVFLLGLNIRLEEANGFILTGNRSLSCNPKIHEMKINKNLLSSVKLEFLIQIAFEISQISNGIVQCDNCKQRYPSRIFSSEAEKSLGDVSSLQCINCANSLEELILHDPAGEGFDYSELKNYLGRSEEVCSLDDLLI